MATVAATAFADALRDVRARTLALERTEPVDRRRDVERDAFKQELARERGAV